MQPPNKCSAVLIPAMLLALLFTNSAHAQANSDEQTLLGTLKKIVAQEDLRDVDQISKLLGLEKSTSMEFRNLSSTTMPLLKKNAVQYRPARIYENRGATSDLIADLRSESCLSFNTWLREMGPAISSPSESGAVSFSHDLDVDPQNTKAQPGRIKLRGMLNAQSCVIRFQLTQINGVMYDQSQSLLQDASE